MSTIKAANLQNTGSGAPAFKNSSGTEIGQLCRAWVKFNGTGTVAINKDFNVSSITDHGTGQYTVNFDTSMPSTNYCATGFAHRNDSTGSRVICHIDQNQGITASTYRFSLSGTNNSQVVGLNVTDTSIIYLAFFDS